MSKANEICNKLMEIAAPYEGDAKPREGDMIVGLQSPYLCQSIFELSFEDLEMHMSMGAENSGFERVYELKTPKHRVVLDREHEYTELSGLAQLVIAGSTKEVEMDVEDLKGSGLIIGRYSIFYGNPSGYTDVAPEDGGYSLDIPKSVATLKALLTHDGFLDAIVARDETQIREAIDDLNKDLERPVLITPYLSEALKN